MAEGALVRFENVGGIGVITVDNAPVNALSPGVPEGISACLATAAADAAVDAIVIIGAGRTFIAGADIREFGKITSGKTPRGAGLLPLLLQIENGKPIVAAIHGSANIAHIAIGRHDDR